MDNLPGTQLLPPGGSKSNKQQAYPLNHISSSNKRF